MLDIYFPYAGVNCLTVWYKGQAEPYSMSPTDWHCQTPNITPSWGRQDSTGHIHRNSCASFHLCQVLNVPAVQTPLGLSRYKKQEKGKLILLVLADTKGLWFVSMARESCEINPTVLSLKNTILAPAAGAVPHLCATRAHETDNLWLSAAGRQGCTFLQSGPNLLSLKTKSIFW